MNAALHHLRHPSGSLERFDDLGLRLDHLVSLGIADLFLRELDQAEARQIGEVLADPVEVAAAGVLGDHRQPTLDEFRADAERTVGPDVDRGLRAFEVQVAQDARLVRGDLGQDARERRVGVLDRVHVARTLSVRPNTDTHNTGGISRTFPSGYL